MEKVNMRKEVLKIAVGFFVLTLFIPAVSVMGQVSIALTAPTTTVQVADGQEFATEVLDNRWDMNELRDIGSDYNFYNPYATIGEWNGEGDGSGNPPYLYLINPGWLFVGIYTNYFHHYTGGTPFGPFNPVDASKYKNLSMRMHVDQAYRDWIAIWWANAPLVWANDNFLNFYDGYFTVSASYSPISLPWSSEYRVYDVDLTTLNWNAERDSTWSPSPHQIGAAWGGKIYGLKISPTGSKALPRNAYTVFDWIRLYDPDTSPAVDISWNVSGYTNDGYYSMQLWMDKDNTNFDGELYMDALTDDGNFNLKTASLPPGDYYFYLKLVRHENSALVEKARSGYTPLIRIGVAPTVEITAPSYTSGVDFATTELLNAWDFSDASDVQGVNEDVTGISYANGAMSADAAMIKFGNVSDAQIYLNMSRNGTPVPIDTSKYRYFTFRLYAELTGSINILDRIQKGWSTRLSWYKTSYGADGTYSKPVQLLEGWHSYGVDLWDNQFVESGYNAEGTVQAGWRGVSDVTFMRFDPLETTLQVHFYLDDIKVCAVNRPSMLGVYELRWSTQDSDSSSLTTTLSYGTKDGSGNFQKVGDISVVQHDPGDVSLLWNTTGIPDGEYYIRAVVSDGARDNTTISEVPVTIPGTQGANPGAIPVPGDYDGDGVFDLAIFHQSTGNWYIRPLGNRPPIVYGDNWGGPGTIPVPGDYDGDGIYDLAVYELATGNWFIKTVSGTLLNFGQNWGGPGLIPAPGDYNNDGIWDLSVYELATGNWYIRSLGPVGPGYPPICFGQNWGTAGMEPVSGDFNGDGLFDLAVYGTATGDWYIRSLGPVGPNYPPICFGQNWGGYGLEPVPGDFNADGLWDLGVYETATGIWYIRSLGDLSDPPITFGQSWGAAGFSPVWGDFNGDGFYDLAVFGENAGVWYIRSLGDLSAPPITFGESWGW